MVSDNIPKYLFLRKALANKWYTLSLLTKSLSSDKVWTKARQKAQDPVQFFYLSVLYIATYLCAALYNQINIIQLTFPVWNLMGLFINSSQFPRCNLESCCYSQDRLQHPWLWYLKIYDIYGSKPWNTSEIHGFIIMFPIQTTTGWWFEPLWKIW